MKARFFRLLVRIFTVALLLQATPIVPAEELPSTEVISAEEVRIVEEEVSKRTESSKTYRCSDGSYTAAVYPYAIHYEENGVYKDIDNTLTLQTAEDGKRSYVNAANALEVALLTERYPS